MEGPLETYEDVLRNDTALFMRYRRELIARGVFEMPESLGRSHISAAHTEDDVDRSLEAAEAALSAALDAGVRALRSGAQPAREVAAVAVDRPLPPRSTSRSASAAMMRSWSRMTAGSRSGARCRRTVAMHGVQRLERAGEEPVPRDAGQRAVEERLRVREPRRRGPRLPLPPRLDAAHAVERSARGA